MILTRRCTHLLHERLWCQAMRGCRRRRSCCCRLRCMEQLQVQQQHQQVSTFLICGDRLLPSRQCVGAGTRLHACMASTSTCPHLPCRSRLTSVCPDADRCGEPKLYGIQACMNEMWVSEPMPNCHPAKSAVPASKAGSANHRRLLSYTSPRAAAQPKGLSAPEGAGPAQGAWRPCSVW